MGSNRSNKRPANIDGRPLKTVVVALLLVALFAAAPLVSRHVGRRLAHGRWMKVRRSVIRQAWQAPAYLLVAGQNLLDPPYAILNRESESRQDVDVCFGLVGLLATSDRGAAASDQTFSSHLAQSAAHPLRC
jgi:hypothetical protein